MSDPHKRRWYQFSLKTLLVVMTLSCVGFSWFGVRLHRAQANRARVAAVRESVAEIEKLGGYVSRQNEERRPRTWLEEQFDDPGDADDPAIIEFYDVYLVSRATDAGLMHVKEMKNLRHLNLRHTNCTESGLENLKGLSKLSNLDLHNTNVTDAGLEHLRGLTKLCLLVLSDTNVTDEGVQKLQQALPKCKIVRW
ncbi:MAG: hypothetical protein IID44_07165 [Planctomycetes bacterium]|nr:hypothetical protein [Planctomycetota bacterium]